MNSKDKERYAKLQTDEALFRVQVKQNAIKALDRVKEDPEAMASNIELIFQHAEHYQRLADQLRQIAETGKKDLEK